MGATNFLTGIIHAFEVTLYLYTWYWTGFNSWQRLNHKNGRKFFHFLTWWIFLSHSFYFVTVFCADLVKIFVGPSCVQSYQFLDYYFSGVVLPSALTSCLVFWVSELITHCPVPKFFSRLKSLLLIDDQRNPTTFPDESPKNNPLKIQNLDKNIARDSLVDSVENIETVGNRSQQHLDISASFSTVEHEENKLASSNIHICAEHQISRHALEVPKVRGNHPEMTDNKARSASQDRSNGGTRNMSMDNRSEHCEFLGNSNVASQLKTRALSVAEGGSCSSVFRMKNTPTERSDLGLVFPAAVNGLPNWVLQVTHSVVGLSTLVETLLSQPTATLPIRSNILVSIFIPVSFSLFTMCCKLTIPKYAKIAQTAIFVSLLVNCLFCSLFAVFSVYLNSWSNFLHTYIALGFDSAVVMQ